MTENDVNTVFNIGKICRMCLLTVENLYKMSTNEIKWYKTLIFKGVKSENQTEDETKELYVCMICKHLLNKFYKFSEQCLRADSLIKQLSQQETPFEIQCIHNLVKTKPKILYSSLDHSDTYLPVKKEENPDSDHDYEDEMPLVMLSRDDERIGKKKRKISRKKEMQVEVEIKDTKLKIESENCRENQVNTDECHERLKPKTKNVIKEGFSSRMVQETDQYVVIKLTKEQVLQEMKLKSESENYKRMLFKCEKCVKGFNFEDVLLSHMEKHCKRNGKLLCDICSQYCPSAVSLRGHMKSHTTRYQCKVCGDVRLSRQHLLEHHSISHTSAATEYSCDLCYYTTNKRTVIQRHVRTHKKNERHACHKCGRLFRTVESLRVHTARHDKSLKLQCDQCPQKFVYPSLLQKHVQCVHVHQDYYCVECDIRFQSPDNLRLHFKKAKKHRDPSSFTHECPECSEKFVSGSSLSVHMITSHGRPKMNVCPLCDKTYSSGESLRGHLRRVHREKKPPGYVCDECGKLFSRKSMLGVHVRTHSGCQHAALTSRARQ